MGSLPQLASTAAVFLAACAFTANAGAVDTAPLHDESNTQIHGPRISTVAFGSCRKQQLPQPIWRAVLDLSPDMWLWTGDAIYPKPGAGEIEIRRAYESAMSNKDALAFFSAVPIVDGVYDDHDYGENDGGKHFEIREQSRLAFLDEVLQSPKDSPRRTQPGGLYGSRVFGTPPQQLKIIMLDTRFSRDSHAIPSPGGSKHLPKAGYLAGATRSMSAVFGIGQTHDGDVLGEDQWEWLRSQLTNSSASVHLIVSSIQERHAQVLTTVPAVESWGHFPASRKRLLSLLAELRPAGALLLSGDVHYAELLGLAHAHGHGQQSAALAAHGADLLEVTSSGPALLPLIAWAWFGCGRGHRRAAQGCVITSVSAGRIVVHAVTHSGYAVDRFDARLGLTHSCGRKLFGRLFCVLSQYLFPSHRLSVPRSLPAEAAERWPAAPPGAYALENFGTISIDWPEGQGSIQAWLVMSGADGRLVIAARAGVAAADAGGMLSVRIHALDGRAVLTRHMKLGLDGEAEGGRWQSALQMQTIFEASRKWRLPFVLAPIVLAWLVGMLLRCHKRRRTVSGKTD